MNIFSFGDKVTISTTLYKTRTQQGQTIQQQWVKHSNVINKTGCIYLGTRTIYHGEAVDDSYGNYELTKRVPRKVALISINQNLNPVYVPLECVTSENQIN